MRAVASEALEAACIVTSLGTVSTAAAPFDEYDSTAGWIEPLSRLTWSARVAVSEGRLQQAPRVHPARTAPGLGMWKTAPLLIGLPPTYRNLSAICCKPKQLALSAQGRAVATASMAPEYTFGGSTR